MERIYDIIQRMDANFVFNEKYYSFEDLRECLKGLNDKVIETEDFILVPFYISQGKRMELYEYTLKIIVEKKERFEDYLLRITGKKDIKDIPDNIIKLNRICYIECENNTHIIKTEYFLKYINFLLFNDDIPYQVQKYFKSFSTNNIFFEIY